MIIDNDDTSMGMGVSRHVNPSIRSSIVDYSLYVLFTAILGLLGDLNALLEFEMTGAVDRSESSSISLFIITTGDKRQPPKQRKFARTPCGRSDQVHDKSNRRTSHTDTNALSTQDESQHEHCSILE